MNLLERTPLITPKITSTPKIFTEAELSLIDRKTVPKHIALIPDGNRRFARAQNRSASYGYKKGGENIIPFVKAAKELGVETLTIYFFSTENWRRPAYEIQSFFSLLRTFLLDKRKEMIDNGVKFETIGNLKPFPTYVKNVIEETKQMTEECQNITLLCALNYGGRDEIRRAVQAIVKDTEAGLLSKEEISEETIKSYLDTAHITDPDLLIRTSGEMRLSNYLLWELSYTEIFIIDTLWPAFTSHHLLEIVEQFQKRKRRFGGET